MAWDSDDLAVFFDADMPATKTATIGAASVSGAFRRDYAEALAGLVSGAAPTFRAATADLVGVSRGDVIEIKALIMHSMETGFRPGPNGQIIPRNIIEHFTATWNDTEIFALEMSPAISANPFVSFFAVATESGTIRLRWSGDQGFAVEEQVAIAVE